MEENFVFEGSTEVEMEGDGFDSSDFYLGTVPWDLSICDTFDRDMENRKLDLFLRFAKDIWNHFWSIDTILTISIVSAKEDVNDIVKTDTFCFKRDKERWHWSPIGSKDYIMNEENGFLVDNKLKVRVEMKFRKVTGVNSLVLNNFSFPSDLSDIIFVVEGKKVYANKMYLSVHSSYFKTMFSAGFKECGMEEIELKDVKHNEFIDLLNEIYPGPTKVDETNVEGLLELADRFDCPQGFRVCEEFLMKTEEITRSEKLIMSSRYRLPDVYDICLNEFQMADIQEMSDSGTFDALDTKTKTHLFSFLMEYYERK